MKTIAFFNGFYVPHLGGVERYTYNIAKELVQRGYRVIVVTTQHELELPNEETVESVKIYRLPVKNFWKQRYPFFNKNELFDSLVKKIKAENIDVYISNTRFHLPALLGVKLAHEAGKEAIVIEHGSSYLTLNNPLADIILRQIERRLVNHVKKQTNQFYGVSKEAASWLVEFGITAKGVFYNAVDIKDYEQFPPEKQMDKTVISYAGRLTPKIKGIEMLLDVFSKLSSKNEKLELILAGDGPLLAPMREKYQQDNIHFLGFVNHDEVMKLNAKSDISVLMSRSEGFSTGMLEAGLLENVIITTPTVGGAKDVMPDADCGYIIDNNETKLLETLEAVLQQPEKMREIQKKVSQQVREHFTWQQTADSFVKIIESKQQGSQE